MSKSEHIQVFYRNTDELAAFCNKQKKTYITGDSHLKNRQIISRKNRRGVNTCHRMTKTGARH